MKFGLKEDIISGIIDVFTSFPEVSNVVLYGSRAKGNFKNGSDIDLVLKGEQLNGSLLNKISLKLDDLYLPYTFDLSVYSDIDNMELLDHINRIGVSFYNKSH
jgi:predicted nucleotidyltransferase